MSDDVPLPEVNIGMVGHVDHGKTTLVAALSGVWTDRHSEELKRGISIKLGYADATFRKCPKCEGTEAYMVEKTCPRHNVETEVLRTVSFVDSPGHETLMATMLSGAALMDGAVLVIAANEKCPRPQTKEHLMALEIIGVDRIVIVQNKIDIVPKERVLENYQEIREFVKGTIAENAPIIPVSAQQRVNIDALIEAIEEVIPTPERDLESPPLMYVARSFDVNKPGTKPEKLVGGVLGGSLSRGRLRVGDEIEIRPGVKDERGNYNPLFSEVVSIMASGRNVEEATPGGLIGVATKLDPFITKGDGLVGNVVGHPDKLPDVLFDFTMEVQLLERVVGAEEELRVEKIKMNEPLMLSVGTSTTLGIVTSARDDVVEVKLKRPVCAEKGSKVAISRRVGSRWRLIGAGRIV
ncbi:translation initiation factor 2 subunit gamma {aeIF-2g} [Geoglobus ahangari]|uniref:Translation initiation factor 2 subunit gamma n=1 Tax=Geoglobus ahangari TaxID=113653 RepID=A0A0F7DCB8_9EURY|nr:translation initiation factor IF-2 subunit gamma [Geoglobus ahangari]AKG92566.1 translation initiation factor 2 subunit gamma {aeIF-2g} [Geoglobus ahangari]NOY10868.1 translation initiation factor IF-2 subunit gamma [Archaeoglobi archaeon]